MNLTHDRLVTLLKIYDHPFICYIAFCAFAVRDCNIIWDNFSCIHLNLMEKVDFNGRTSGQPVLTSGGGW